MKWQGVHRGCRVGQIYKALYEMTALDCRLVAEALYERSRELKRESQSLLACAERIEAREKR
jgi:hypothetical protein